MRFFYKYFEPKVGDLVADGMDGTTGIITSVGEWIIISYNKQQGLNKRMAIYVNLSEYNGITEQYVLKFLVQDDLIASPLKFIHRDDIELVDVEM